MTEERLRMVKFRGESITGGTYVTGYFYARGRCYIGDDNGSETAVKPETVVPMVGYDINGDEVYEGDWLYDEIDEYHYKVVWDKTEWCYRLDCHEIGICTDANEMRRMQLSLGPDEEDEEDKDE